MSDKKRLGVFRERFADVGNHRGGMLQQILKIHKVGSVILNETLLDELLDKNAPLDVYVLAKTEKRQKRSSKIQKVEEVITNNTEEDTESGDDHVNGSTED